MSACSLSALLSCWQNPFTLWLCVPKLPVAVVCSKLAFWCTWQQKSVADVVHVIHAQKCLNILLVPSRIFGRFMASNVSKPKLALFIMQSLHTAHIGSSCRFKLYTNQGPVFCTCTEMGCYHLQESQDWYAHTHSSQWTQLILKLLIWRLYTG